MMKNVHDNIVRIAIKSSELLELVQWDLPADQTAVREIVDELKSLLDELDKEMSPS
jgi:hypothetical protein